jgi:acetylornithine deacetylase/succinyl-diaminopimelate desuccinylase-like protein
MNEQQIATIVSTLEQSALFKNLANYCRQQYEKMIGLLVKICQIPAPTFNEDKRATFIADYMNNIGLEQVKIDKQKNVIGVYKGKISTPSLAIIAHIDTVFPIGTPLTIKKTETVISCPGVGDNTASVVAMLFLAEAWKDAGYIPPFDIYFVGSSCEEGLGDLKGIKEFFKNTRTTFNNVSPLKAIIVLDGLLSDISHIGIGSRRLRVVIKAKGGHSWGNFGNPSAIHALGSCIAEISKLKVPTEPKTTFNVGLISGGTSINSIAEMAEMAIDLRSVDPSALKSLETIVRGIINEKMVEYQTEAEITVVGDRPSASIPKSHPIVLTALTAAKKLDIPVKIRESSTDANIPLSIGMPAITIGSYIGNGAHTLSESIDIHSLLISFPYISLTTLAIISLAEQNL